MTCTLRFGHAVAKTLAWPKPLVTPLLRIIPVLGLVVVPLRVLRHVNFAPSLRYPCTHPHPSLGGSTYLRSCKPCSTPLRALTGHGNGPTRNCYVHAKRGTLACPVNHLCRAVDGNICRQPVERAYRSSPRRDLRALACRRASSSSCSTMASASFSTQPRRRDSSQIS